MAQRPEGGVILVPPIYKCFYWQGDRAALASAETRCDHNSSLPPASVRGWPSKPDHLCKATFDDHANALAWMWAQMRAVAAYMQQHFPQHVPDIARQFQAAQRQLEHGELAGQWAIDLPNRTCVFIAVVAVWEDEPV